MQGHGAVWMMQTRLWPRPRPRAAVAEQVAGASPAEGRATVRGAQTTRTQANGAAGGGAPRRARRRGPRQGLGELPCVPLWCSSLSGQQRWPFSS